MKRSILKKTKPALPNMRFKQNRKKRLKEWPQEILL